MLENLVFIVLISLPIFFLIKRILKARIANSRNRNMVSLFSAFIIAPVIYISLTVGFLKCMEHYPKNDFDSSTWESNENIRFKMSKDIIESKMLLGKTKEEVINILGNDFSQTEADYMTYYLGFVPGFLNIDPDVLDIYFENKRVIRVDQRRT